MAIKLSVGKEPFEIEFDNGHKDTIYFNPNDPDLGARFIQAKKNIEKKINMLSSQDIKLNNMGDLDVPNTVSGVLELDEEEQKKLTENAEAFQTIIDQTRKIICDEIDVAFGAEVSNVVFQFCSPLAIINGEYMILQFLNAISPEIVKRNKKASDESKKRMSKHKNKYARK